VHCVKNFEVQKMTSATTAPQQLPYIETASGNRVSRTSVLYAPQRIAFDGKTTIHAGVQLRGDLGKSRKVKFTSTLFLLNICVFFCSSYFNWSMVAR
jgi:hypothetical protein